MANRIETWTKGGRKVAFSVTDEEVILTYELWSQILEELGWERPRDPIR